jgi:hypothetical protein
MRWCGGPHIHFIWPSHHVPRAHMRAQKIHVFEPFCIIRITIYHSTRWYDPFIFPHTFPGPLSHHPFHRYTFSLSFWFFIPDSMSDSLLSGIFHFGYLVSCVQVLVNRFTLPHFMTGPFPRPLQVYTSSNWHVSHSL